MRVCRTAPYFRSDSSRDVVYITHVRGQFSMVDISTRVEMVSILPKGRRWKHLADQRAFRSRIVRYWHWHALGCRAIELGKSTQGGVICDRTLVYGTPFANSRDCCITSTIVCSMLCCNRPLFSACFFPSKEP